MGSTEELSAYLLELDPRDWTPAQLGLRVTASQGFAEYGLQELVPPDPAPLLTSWLTADGQRFRRDAFAGGATIKGLTFAAAYEQAVGNLRAWPVLRLAAELVRQPASADRLGRHQRQDVEVGSPGVDPERDAG